MTHQTLAQGVGRLAIKAWCGCGGTQTQQRMFACDYGQAWAPPRAPESYASLSEHDALHRLVRDLEKQNRELARSNSQLTYAMNQSDRRLRSLLASSAGGGAAPNNATRAEREARFHPAVATGRGGGGSGHFKRSSALERVGGSRFHAEPARSHHHHREHHRGGAAGCGRGGGGGGGFSDTRGGAQDAEESSRDPSGV